MNWPLAIVVFGLTLTLLWNACLIGSFGYGIYALF
jgi:hypothetical protein